MDMDGKPRVGLYADSYLPGIRVRKADLDGLSERKAGCEGRMAEYERELAAETARLRAKHGYDCLAGQIRDVELAISEASADIVRETAIMIVQVLAELFRADERGAGEVADALGQDWKIEVTHNANVTAENYVACFTAYAAEVGDPAWWSGREAVPQSSGVLWLGQEKPYHWSPCFDVGIPGSLLDDPAAFLDWARARLEDMAAKWADRWVRDTASDRCRQEALRRALSAHLDAPADGDGPT